MTDSPDVTRTAVTVSRLHTTAAAARTSTNGGASSYEGIRMHVLTLSVAVAQLRSPALWMASGLKGIVMRAKCCNAVGY